MADGKRIEFVDLTKGICIILVVMSHVGGPFVAMDSHHIISAFRMPLYFFISGIFFKSYEGLWGFFVRKLNKLIIPFIFFYIGAFLFKYVVFKVAPNVFQLPVQWSDLLVVFHKHDLIGFNPPIWFLLALFNCNILFYIVHKLRDKHLKLMFLVVLLIGVAGFVLGKLRIELPLYIDTAMTALPFYMVGFWIRRYNFFLYPHRFDKLIPVFIVLALGAMFLMNTYPVGMRTNHYEGNIFTFYVAAFAGILVIMLIGKRFKKAPIISYMGRYSVITLGVHAILLHICRSVLGKFIHNDLIFHFALLAVVLTISLIATPIFLKIIPQFVAQKDFFSTKKLVGEANAEPQPEQEEEAEAIEETREVEEPEALKAPEPIAEPVPVKEHTTRHLPRSKNVDHYDENDDDPWDLKRTATGKTN